MVIGIICLIILICITMYALMDIAKVSDRREEEIFKDYLKGKENNGNETKEE